MVNRRLSSAVLSSSPRDVVKSRKADGRACIASGLKAPLRPDLLEKVIPLPPAHPKDDTQAAVPGSGTGKKVPAQGEKKIPKWLQKGLMKKK